jgi:hypothetical protein
MFLAPTGTEQSWFEICLNRGGGAPAACYICCQAQLALGLAIEEAQLQRRKHSLRGLKIGQTFFL